MSRYCVAFTICLIDGPARLPSSGVVLARKISVASIRRHLAIWILLGRDYPTVLFARRSLIIKGSVYLSFGRHYKVEGTNQVAEPV